MSGRYVGDYYVIKLLLCIEVHFQFLYKILCTTFCTLRSP